MPSKKKKYQWVPGSPPPILETHSKAKHEVIASYLKRYIEVLLANPRDGLTLTVVDGFAGGGTYTDEHTGGIVDGSPLVILNTLREVIAEIQQIRTKTLRINIQLILIEKNKAAVTCLEEAISQVHVPDSISVKFILGRFESNLDQVLSVIARPRSRNPRAIFLLDQYGYTDVAFSTVRTIFSRVAGAEILLTFATDCLLNYMADDDKYKGILKKLELDDYITEEMLREGVETKESRALAVNTLHTGIRNNTQAGFYTPFFIKSQVSSRSYWLIHLSNHVTARQEMLKIHWQLKNHFAHHGRHGLNMLGYDPDHDDFGQLALEFVFDDHAQTMTHAALLEDLPRFLNGLERLSFSNLVEKVSNDTPATSEQISAVLSDLKEHGEITITTPAGNIKRSAAKVGKDDLIETSSQLIFDYGRITKN